MASTMDPVDRGKALQGLRKQAGLTQRAVGAHFHIDKAAVSEWETGKSDPAWQRRAELDKLYNAHGAVLALYEDTSYTMPRDRDAEMAALRQRVAELEMANLDARISRLSAGVDRRLRQLEREVERALGIHLEELTLDDEIEPPGAGGSSDVAR